MARPVGSFSHWWDTRKRLVIHLYNPTDETIESVRQFVRELNANAKEQKFGAGV